MVAAPLVVLRIVTVFLKVCSGFVPCNIVELLQGNAEVEWQKGLGALLTAVGVMDFGLKCSWRNILLIVRFALENCVIVLVFYVLYLRFKS